MPSFSPVMMEHHRQVFGELKHVETCWNHQVFFTIFALVLPFTTNRHGGSYLIPAGVAVLVMFVVGYGAVSTP